MGIKWLFHKEFNILDVLFFVTVTLLGLSDNLLTYLIAVFTWCFFSETGYRYFWAKKRAQTTPSTVEKHQKLAIGTPVLASNDGENWVKRNFYGLDAAGIPLVYEGDLSTGAWTRTEGEYHKFLKADPDTPNTVIWYPNTGTIPDACYTHYVIVIRKNDVKGGWSSASSYDWSLDAPNPIVEYSVLPERRPHR